MAKYLPHGTTFSINSKEVGGLVSVSLPDRSRGTANVTDTESVQKEYLPGMREPGTVKLSFRHDPDDQGQKELESNFMSDPADAVVTCVITLPNAATTASGSKTYTFDGFVTEPPKGDLALDGDDPANATATIKVTGDVTIAPA